MATVDIDAIRSAVQRAEAQIPELEKEVARASAAGIDVTDSKTRLAQLKEQVQKLKTYYLS